MSVLEHIKIKNPCECIQSFIICICDMFLCCNLQNFSYGLYKIGLSFWEVDQQILLTKYYSSKTPSRLFLLPFFPQEASCFLPALLLQPFHIIAGEVMSLTVSVQTLRLSTGMQQRSVLHHTAFRNIHIVAMRLMFSHSVSLDLV